jgi:NAD(P)-dependent dehydrogenase (short-subunit alcohol dehydrogenase family)
MGRAGAIALAEEAATVVVADIDETRADEVVRIIQAAAGKAISIRTDVSEPDQVTSLVTEAVERYGSVDILYHCAADLPFINAQDRCLIDLSEGVWERMIRIHLTGTFLVCKYVGRQMAEQGSGSIVLTATTDALVGCAGLDSYTAAKGGVVALTRSFAAGMAPYGVRVNAVCPGFVTTENQRGWLEQPGAEEMIAQLHLLPIATPEQIVPLVVFLTSDEAAIVTGSVFAIDSGYTAFKAKLDVMGMIRGRNESQ